MKANNDTLIKCLKTNNVLLNKVQQNEIYEYMKNEINVRNAAIFYYLSKPFNISSLSKISMRVIERCFPMVAESQTFLELKLVHVKNIISSNELNVDSELQVLNAAGDWMSHKLTKRRKYSICLFSMIRLSLLSSPALKYIFDKKSRFRMGRKCAEIIREIFNNRNPRSYKLSGTSRYCTQDKFNAIVCGGENINTRNIVNNVCSLEADNLCSVNNLAPMPERRGGLQAVCVKDEVYVFGGVAPILDESIEEPNLVQSIEKYSPAANAWEKVADMYDVRVDFCVCSFMNSIYIIGGRRPYSTNVGRSIVEFNTISRTWKEHSRTNVERVKSSCAVFQGKIVVSGGYSYPVEDRVEVYDHVADSWSEMREMCERRHTHKSVGVKNKLFIIGGVGTPRCEVYDSRLNIFLWLKPHPASFTNNLNYPAGVISIGSKVVVFVQSTGRTLLYDFEDEEWMEKPCEAIKYIKWYSCAKSPQL